MPKRAEIELFGHFIEFGWFDWYDIAYNDSAECFSTFANDYMLRIVYWRCIVSIICAEQNPNRMVFGCNGNGCIAILVAS